MLIEKVSLNINITLILKLYLNYLTKLFYSNCFALKVYSFVWKTCKFKGFSIFLVVSVSLSFDLRKNVLFFCPDIISAYKGILKEKEALEASFQCLTNSKKLSPASLDNGDKDNDQEKSDKEKSGFSDPLQVNVKIYYFLLDLFLIVFLLDE